MADAFHDFENGIQNIFDSDPYHERSLKFKHIIQNAIAACKQLCQEKKVTSLTLENDFIFQADDRW